MTQTAIEAKSLASLITLAANPPLRPQNGVRLDPLVLYIARVPGSRDVFLSPIKPRQKIVTAEDVESCLYYLHVGSPEDESLLDSAVPDQLQIEEIPPELPARPRPTEQNALPGVLRPGHPNINRHPLPPIPPYPVEDGPPQLNAYTPMQQPPHMTVSRKPAPSIPLRKPVGPQTMREVETETPPLPQRPFLGQRPTMSTTASQSSAVPVVTVIRRHPATGDQWNVGTIADPPVFDIASDDRRGSMTSTRIRKSGQPLYLNITNPGYAKFSIGDGSSHAISPASSTPSLAFSNGTIDSSSSDSSFARRMWLEGSLFEKKAAKHRKALSADQADHGSLSIRPTFDSRRSSEFSHHSQGLHAREGNTSYVTQDMHRLSMVGDQKRSNTRGYTFLSPWEGRCEFASGTTGNSLKCQHLRSGNSLAPESNVPAQVSELRFNLPGGGPMASQPRQRSPPKPKDKESRRSRLLAKFSDRDSSHDVMPHREIRALSEYSQDLRLDLSLGQELAGGGFAGKQAKLGKLIIEGEGLLMLDLLVAANMALWFRAYEKHQGG